MKQILMPIRNWQNLEWIEFDWIGNDKIKMTISINILLSNQYEHNLRSEIIDMSEGQLKEKFYEIYQLKSRW
jgi:hypothetical protein